MPLSDDTTCAWPTIRVSGLKVGIVLFGYTDTHMYREVV